MADELRVEETWIVGVSETETTPDIDPNTSIH
jgi:hypothetical protein